MKLSMDNLPTVISCCFCCFLRAGTVMIAVFSFCSGLVFAPNVSTKGFVNMDPVLTYYSAATESTIQITLGVASIMLCVVSVLLLVGSICNMPKLILVYQWGAVVYCITVFLLLLVLALFCFFVHTNCVSAGAALCGLMVIEVLCKCIFKPPTQKRWDVISLTCLCALACVQVTTYFVIVANSLRMSQMFLSSSELYT